MDLHGHSDPSARWYSLRQRGDNFLLSPHFKLFEFASGDGDDKVLVHPVLIEGLENLREHFGDKRVTINSGYRTLIHNARVGGSENSRHLWGLAADIAVEGVEPDAVAEYAEGPVPWRNRATLSLGPQWGGVGRYNTFTHVDVSKAGRRWDRRAA